MNLSPSPSRGRGINLKWCIDVRVLNSYLTLIFSACGEKEK
jgi:hypothetical protein